MVPTSETDCQQFSDRSSSLPTQDPVLGVVKELVRTYQCFSQYSDSHIRRLGLTPGQFEVIATLGQTSGLTMNCLAEKTLVTKGTLTGIVDRLEQKGLVRREVPPENRHCFRIVLTPKGEALFARVYPQQLAHWQSAFDPMTESELHHLYQVLSRLRHLFVETPAEGVMPM